MLVHFLVVSSWFNFESWHQTIWCEWRWNYNREKIASVSNVNISSNKGLAPCWFSLSYIKVFYHGRNAILFVTTISRGKQTKYARAYIQRFFYAGSDHRSAMTTSNDIMALSVFSCLCFRGNLLSWFTIFSCCAAQETMLRSLHRQVDFKVIDCKGSKDPRICPPTLTKTYVWCMILEYDMT